MRRSDQRRDAVFACYQHDVTGRSLSDLERGMPKFTQDLVRGVAEHRQELDDEIASNLQGWTIDRLAPLDLNLMRVALFEIRHRPDVPDEVAIDEAIETAKRYCGVDAPGFVNGVLGGAIGQAVGDGADA